MTTEQTHPIVPIRDVDHLVDRYLDLKAEAEAIAGQMDAIKHQLRDLGVGQHQTSTGVPVVVQAPARTFAKDKAWAMLTPEQQAVCVSPDPKKIKAQLAGVVVESLMVPGKGDPIVKVG